MKSDGKRISKKDSTVVRSKAVTDPTKTHDEKANADEALTVQLDSSGVERLADVQQTVQKSAAGENATKDEKRSLGPKNLKYRIPSVRQVRNGLVDQRYGECLARIRERLDGKKMWAAVDDVAAADSGDGGGDMVGRVTVGTLSADGPGETFLLAAGVLQRGEGAAVRLFDEAMRRLWPDGAHRRDDDLLLFLSSCTGETADDWPGGAKTVRVACLARQLDVVAEQICAQYPAVDSFVSMVQRVFSLAPDRLSELEVRAPGVPRPPPALLQHHAGPSSSAAWIEGASYLNEHLAAIRTVLVGRANPRESWPSWCAGRLAIDPATEPGLAFVDLNYGWLPGTIAQLRGRGPPLVRSVAAVFDAEDKLAEVAGQLGAVLHLRFADALRQNRGFQVLAEIAEIMAGRSATMDGLPTGLSGHELKYFKYAPVAAVDVRETWPRYEAIFTRYNRRVYGDENLNKLLVAECNVFATDDTSSDSET